MLVTVLLAVPCAATCGGCGSRPSVVLTHMMTAAPGQNIQRRYNGHGKYDIQSDTKQQVNEPAKRHLNCHDEPNLDVKSHLD